MGLTKKKPSSAALDDPFYQGQWFFRFFPPALVYCAICKVTLFLLRSLFPFLVRDVASPREILPEERFVIPLTSPSSSSISNDTNDSDRHVAIVTGSNTGLGFETASSLVELGYIVILACRNTSKAEEAAAKINARNNQKTSSTVEGGKQQGRALFLHPLDLSSMESVRSFAEVFTSEYNHLNILVNNAGLQGQSKTADGMDACFQTNFIGHYLLTRILLPHLLKARNTFPSKEGGIAGNGTEAGRVVNLSSATHHFASPNTERAEGATMSGAHDEDFWRGCATPFVSGNTYAESKFAMILFTQVLNEKFGSQGLRAVSCDPGSVSSDMWRGAPPMVLKIIDMLMLSTKQGSSTSLASAVGDLPKDALFLQPYWQPGKCKVLSNSKAMPWLWYPRPNPITEMSGIYVGFAVTDCRLPPSPESRYALWNVCEELVGLKTKETLK
eukprot:CAMPEP_0203719136 /NCGR_PEP_ID=MMETSP0092-20131115/3250_1 /ASSEMBLY_ACC=CAM_ASM_001090 /TAXON_ID=426623 /ORGANISM="Chaetoceros affinis, Strain CCMP159" /LENGTH=442 /DNA_ID=CAMNT_0050598467 /DNA_START=29 /DNA_END=1357 /DNA_ORIENTATION=-